MIGVPLVAQIHDRGLAEHRTAVMSIARPAVAINTEPCAEEELPVGATKFGGLPSLPRGMEWPRCEGGRDPTPVYRGEVAEWRWCAGGPLEFLAQFDLAELWQTVAGRVLRPEGLLSFFMYHNYPADEFGGFQTRGVEGGLRILYTPPGTDLCLANPPDDLTDDLGRPGRPCRLSLTDALDLPAFHPIWQKFHDGLGLLVGDADHQLFGYSYVTVLASDPTPGPEWEQLIRFDSDRKLNWGWGDGHRLFWYIRSDDLRNFQFDKTEVSDG